MIGLLVALALAGPADLRPGRIEGLELLARGEVPMHLEPMNGALGRRFEDEQGRIYARGEVYDLLDDVDSRHMRTFWRNRRRSHRWGTVIFLIPPPWSLGAVAAHLQWRQRAGRELEQALATYNALSTAEDLL